MPLAPAKMPSDGWRFCHGHLQATAAPLRLRRVVMTDGAHHELTLGPGINLAKRAACIMISSCITKIHSLIDRAFSWSWVAKMAVMPKNKHSVIILACQRKAGRVATNPISSTNPYGVYARTKSGVMEEYFAASFGEIPRFKLQNRSEGHQKMTVDQKMNVLLGATVFFAYMGGAHPFFQLAVGSKHLFTP